MRKKYIINDYTEEEREQIKQNIINLLKKGLDNKEIAHVLKVERGFVSALRGEARIDHSINREEVSLADITLKNQVKECIKNSMCVTDIAEKLDVPMMTLNRCINFLIKKKNITRKEIICRIYEDFSKETIENIFKYLKEGYEPDFIILKFELIDREFDIILLNLIRNGIITRDEIKESLDRKQNDDKNFILSQVQNEHIIPEIVRMKEEYNLSYVNRVVGQLIKEGLLQEDQIVKRSYKKEKFYPLVLACLRYGLPVSEIEDLDESEFLNPSRIRDIISALKKEKMITREEIAEAKSKYKYTFKSEVYDMVKKEIEIIKNELKQENEQNEKQVISEEINDHKKEISSSDEYIKIISMFDNELFRDYIKTKDFKERVIISFKLGYIDGKYFSTESISKFLDINSSEINKIFEKCLIEYKEILINQLDAKKLSLLKEYKNE